MSFYAQILQACKKFVKVYNQKNQIFLLFCLLIFLSFTVHKGAFGLGVRIGISLFEMYFCAAQQA